MDLEGSVTRCLLTVSTVFTGALAVCGQAPTKPYAQILIDETVLRNPELSLLSIAVPSPDSAENTVIASNDATTIGRKASDDDVRVFASKKPETTLDISYHRCRALVPAHDATGTTIGTLRAAFAVSSRATEPDCRRRAETLRDRLGQVIPSSARLFDPFIVASSSTDILAQKLTIETLAKHQDLLVLAFHITPPGDTVNRVVGINQPKFLGRPSDDVDHEVATTGKTIVQVIPSTHRMETHMPMRAADGSLVGTLVTVYLWQNETETPELMSRSMRIRDELQLRIPSLAALVSRE
jgi:hypothetical protein